MAIVAVYVESGQVRVLHPALSQRMAGETLPQFFKRIADKDVPPGVPYKLVDDANLPPRRFRSAWLHDGAGNVTIDLAAARAQRKAELLDARDVRLRIVRAKLATADEDNDLAALQALRDRSRALRGLDGTADAQLAAVSDPAVLDTFQPAEFAAGD